jgi:hypothetical protein
VNALDLTEDKIDDMKEYICEGLERIFDKLPECYMELLLEDLNAKAGN